MNSKIQINAIIDAPLEKVWKYYTEPEHIINWNFASPDWHCPTAKNELQVGGKYIARMEAKDGSFGFDFEATYTNIVPGKEFTYEFGGRTANVQFNELNDKTEIVIIFDPEDENPIEMQKGGWQSILNNFKKYTEEN